LCVAVTDPSACPASQPHFTVNAAGDQATMTYQWYQGNVGDYSHPLVGDYRLDLAITAQTNVWCDIGSGAAHVSTRTATAYLEAAPPVSQIGQYYYYGYSWILSVSVPEEYLPTVTYNWYQGAIGDTSHLIGQSYNVMVSPTQTTSYWVRVRCGTGCSTDRGVTLQVWY
jgi:hypothetical protein